MLRSLHGICVLTVDTGHSRAAGCRVGPDQAAWKNHYGGMEIVRILDSGSWRGSEAGLMRLHRVGTCQGSPFQFILQSLARTWSVLLTLGAMDLYSSLRPPIRSA